MTTPPPGRPYTLDEIVLEAEGLSTDERLSFLKRVCGEDDALFTLALDRLRASAPEWWHQSIDSRALTHGESISRIGETIGPYRIVRQLGQGGMGEVVLAERNDQQFRQQVAIKLVKSGVLSRNIQGRLKVERQILATLDHPNIARLLDGGNTRDGTPYIVMEYIEGESIDTYCDRRRLTLNERLRLFRTVCAAVHAAHQNLIVHRDLKPSNILVTRDGIPKLLDFGIAKVLDERQMMHTLAVTQLDVRVMTPEHASPEQIRGEPITTSSDIYALGVLLYELLTGRKPYVFKSARLSEIEVAICEQQPLPLHVALHAHDTSDDSAVRAICDSRSTTPSRLRRELRGDLANIVMTALRKEPERRYPSAERFSVDIERYLEGKPVSAARDSLVYRARKFVQRHRLAAAFTGAAALGLAAFAVTATMQSARIAREQARAAQVSSFLVDMFQQADPTHSRGRDITVREMLDIGSRRLDAQLGEQPDTRAHLQATVGKVYSDLGFYDEAESLLRASIAARTELYGAESLETAISKQYLGDVLLKKKDYVGALPLLEDALAVQRAAFGDHRVSTAAILRDLGEIHQERHELAVAEKLCRESLQLLADAGTRSVRIERLNVDAERAATLNRLGLVLVNKGDDGDRDSYTMSEDMFRRALAVSEEALGSDHPNIAFIKHNLALSVELQGRLSEARPLFDAALELYRKVFGPEHPETLTALANYGYLLQRLRDLDGAERVYREVLALRRKVLGDVHSRVGYDRVNLGILLHDRERYREAESEFREALTIYATSLPANHAFKAAALRSLAITQMALGKAPEAELKLRQAIDIFAATAGPESAQVLATRAALGRALAMQRRFREAEPLLLENYRQLVKARGPENPTVLRARSWIEDFYRDAGRPDEANGFFASATPPLKPARP